MSDIETLRERACRFVLQIPRGTIDADLLDPAFDCWNASMGGMIDGPTYLEGIAGAARVLPDLRMTIDGTVAEGSGVAVRASSVATLPDGSIYANNYHFLFEFNGDRIRRVHAFMNTKAAEDVLRPLIWGERSDFAPSNRGVGPMASDNAAVARAFLESIPTGKIPAELTTEDFSGWTTGSGDLPGDKFRGGVGLLSTIFAKPMTIDVQAVTAQDDRVVIETIGHGTLIDGNEYRNRYVFVFRMRDGKVASVAEHNNPVIVREVIAPLMKAAMEKAAGEKAAG